MKIGLVDVDGHNFPNLPLMKLSAFYKGRGDFVEWYDPFSGLNQIYDVVFMSKVFSFTPDYNAPIYTKKLEKGGTGYAITNENGKEKYNNCLDHNLPYEIEHIYPDYSIYPELTKDTAFGFMSRGCPRGCDFCHVKDKEGLVSHKVADLNEFWRGQKNIELLDPNVLACKEWQNILTQLINSKAVVNFNQGLDIRLITEQKAEMLAAIPQKSIHFAWDRYEDKEIIQPRLKTFRKLSKINPHNLFVYVLCGDREKRVLPQDLERIYWLRDNGYAPYVMLYDKDNLKRGHELRKLQRYVNNRFIFWTISDFEEYKSTIKREGGD